jgi:hypothetical protein
MDFAGFRSKLEVLSAFHRPWFVAAIELGSAPVVGRRDGQSLSGNLEHGRNHPTMMNIGRPILRELPMR